MPTKTKKKTIPRKLAKAMRKVEKNYEKRVRKYDNLPTLRDVLGRVKDKCDLIVYEGQRYWRLDLATEMDDWRFLITKHELQLIEGVYDNREKYSFPLSQPVKIGKKSIKLVEDDIEIRILTVSEASL